MSSFVDSVDDIITPDLDVYRFCKGEMNRSITDPETRRNILCRLSLFLTTSVLTSVNRFRLFVQTILYTNVMDTAFRLIIINVEYHLKDLNITQVSKRIFCETQ